MKARLLSLSLLVFVCAISVSSQTVAESESSILIRQGSAEVSLSVTAKSRLMDTPIELTLLDPTGKPGPSSSQNVAIASGKRKYKFSIALGDLMKQSGDEIAWWRLGYRVGAARGIVSVSELLRDDFDLRAAAFARVMPGEVLRVRIRSLSPFTERAVRGVDIKAELVIGLDTESDDDELKLKGTARTDGDGFAMIDFTIPPGVKLDGDAEITISGRKNGVVRKIEEDLEGDSMVGSVVLTSDKPLYQPGQMFNVRGLMLDPNNTVVPGYELEFKIEDEDDTVVFRQKVKTSDFGIAAISWPIPDNAKLGTYRVIVEADEGLSEDQLQFKVSRYDLPNFAVSAKPDKTYYLLSDTEASITINADYLFGKPVTNGKVRVVQESERRWNYTAQKYDVEEGTVNEGATDASGKFVAKFDLAEDLAALRNREWRRFEDISFAAYYTDLTTNRTEQRRFDIRLTKEPIHVYLVRYASQHPDLPLTAYISTFYADGTPAVCNVEVKDLKDTVSRFKTNSIGAGKLEIEIPPDNIQGSSYDLKISARDKKGLTGTFEESFDLEDDDAIQIRTDKAIYKPGEMVDLEIRSSQKEGYVYVDMVKEWSPIESKVVELSDGKARLLIPYKPSFKGDLVIAAYTDKEDGRWTDTMRAVRGIVFPEQQNLLINAKFSKDEYRPSEDATVKFSVLDGSRKPIESAIGLGIFDKAIEERARTENEFGQGTFSRFFRLMGYQRSFGGITLKDINDLNLSQPITPEMQLAAEIMLSGNWYLPSVYHSSNLDAEARTLYKDLVAKQIAPIANTIEAQFKKDGDHPVDQNSFERILKQNGLDLEQLRDPWGQSYAPTFSVKRSLDSIELRTSGPDKKPGTPDDFIVWTSDFSYFDRTGAVLDRAVFRYHERTGRYVRDPETLNSVLNDEGVTTLPLKDRWGRDYRITLEVSGRSYVIRIYSFGPNGVYDPDNYKTDDFEVWKIATAYFGESEREINRILSEEVNQNKKPFPRTEKEFSEMLRRGGLNLATVKDGYGRSVYVVAMIEPRYTDKTEINNGKVTTTPVTEEMMSFKIRSNGADVGMISDDFDLAMFSGAITAAHKGLGFAKVDVTTTVFSGAKGAIGGTITDPNGAVVPNAEVIATDMSDASKQFSARSNEEGKFLLANLPSGKYTIRVPAPVGFLQVIVQEVTVRSQSLVEVNITLQVGATSNVVDVTASAEVDQTSNATATNISTRTITKFNIPLPSPEQTSTPRLREYFPESLVWRPELLTDKRGKAELKFKMADNITTWKMFAIASNKKGKIGVVEKEITAFQSFFVDLDPPKFLTAGDEIHLPTQVRNYTAQNQKVEVTMDKADWFTFLGSENKQRINVATGASQNAVFGFTAVTPIKIGKQRVTAIGQSDSDAIERPVTVRPNGEEIVRTDSKVFDTSAKFDINFPANALPNTPKAKLKIYPNLFSHVAESVEGMLERPYGCGEQTISSTYPNLMILKFIKSDSPLTQKARRYLQKGYERLLGYQVADGGFTYWGGKDISDVALTAYALRFLNDAKEFVEIDDGVIRRAEDWLIAQQRTDGTWTKRYRWETTDDASRTKLTTTYVARSLAMSRDTSAQNTAAARSKKQIALDKALDYFKTRNAEIDEPYALSLFGLASLDAGDTDMAKRIASQLEKMAISEGHGVYWKLETNTPFYGWGTAGRIETTALALQLLTRVAKLESKPASDTATKALMFLLKNKDRYGVWYSTQTTINVLDSFLAVLASPTPAQPQTIQIAVNGVNLPGLDIAADRIDPIDIDLQDKLSSSSNTIEVRSSINSPLMVQTVATHYVDWRDSESSNANTTTSRALRLDYKCDKPTAAIMDEISCSVETERIGFKGYGMLLAEIGTPPGADVSRESLEAALSNDWSLSRYDVLPDRIVFYMWSKAGGTKFNFKFRPRYGINAQTPASIVYDYYNPEASATVAPLRFSVR